MRKTESLVWLLRWGDREQGGLCSQIRFVPAGMGKSIKMESGIRMERSPRATLRPLRQLWSRDTIALFHRLRPAMKTRYVRP